MMFIIRLDLLASAPAAYPCAHRLPRPSIPFHRWHYALLSYPVQQALTKYTPVSGASAIMHPYI